MCPEFVAAALEVEENLIATLKRFWYLETVALTTQSRKEMNMTSNKKFACRSPVAKVQRRTVRGRCALEAPETKPS